MTPLKWTLRKRLILAASLGALGVLCVALTGPMARITLCGYLMDGAQELIDGAMSANLKTFLVVSAIKASVAVIEGSSLGIGFDLQVGDLVQPLYDYIDFVWKSLMYSLVILGLYKLLLQTGLLLLGLKAIGVGLCLWAAVLARPQWRRQLWVIGQRFIIAGLLFAYVVPLALMATHYASAWYTAPLKETYDAQLATVQVKLVATGVEFMALRNKVSLTQPSDSFEQIKKEAMALARSMADIVWGSALSLIYLVLVLLFESLVFPLTSVYLLTRFLSFALNRLFGDALPSTAKRSTPPVEGSS